MVRLKEAFLFGRFMFQAVGVHGPELTPFAHGVMVTVLVAASFVLLMGSRRPHPSVVAGLGTLIVVAGALRVAFQPLPNIQPVTVAALLIGARLGAARGAAFAVLVALVSNVLIGEGWWTLFQALGWASVAWLGSRCTFQDEHGFDLRGFIRLSFASAFVFGLVVSFSLVEPGMTLIGFAQVLFLGLPFDLVHAVGNVAFAAWLGPALHRFLDDVRTMEASSRAVGDFHVVHG